MWVGADEETEGNSLRRSEEEELSLRPIASRRARVVRKRRELLLNDAERDTEAMEATVDAEAREAAGDAEVVGVVDTEAMGESCRTPTTSDIASTRIGHNTFHDE